MSEIAEPQLTPPLCAQYAFTADKSHVLDAENMSNHTRYINAIEPYNCVPRRPFEIPDILHRSDG